LPCTGVRHLANRLPADDDKDILLTTFNKNLAADLRGRLVELGGPGMLQRVDVVNIDALASRIATEAEPTVRRHWLDDIKAVERWQDMLGELVVTGWNAEFLHDERSQVVLGHAIARGVLPGPQGQPRTRSQPTAARRGLAARHARK
jgi:hypothetical protein